MAVAPPSHTVRAPRWMVATADHLATQAGLAALVQGGNAVDAAIAANAAIAVTGPHLCGMGGDLFALVVQPGGQVHCLNSSGRAGSGASAAALRADGHTAMPFRHDIRSVTVPGCVDGWVALHQRFGTLPLASVLAPAIALAEGGFPASPLLVGAASVLDDAGRANLHELAGQARRPGARVRRPGVGRALRAVAVGGRDAFYLGEFGDGLQALGDGWFTAADLAHSQADWVPPLRTSAWGHDLWTVPPNSQGYLTIGAAALVSAHLDLPPDPDDERWAHLLVEAATAAGHDRPGVLHEHADGAALLTAIAGRSAMVDPDTASRRPVPGADGDTTYLCTADAGGMAVSLIQSNASGFGSWLAEPATGINLHNRGLGFSLADSHPAELRPQARPPHTLSPAAATRAGRPAAVFGTMGGDGQPQILLQVAARLFLHQQSPAQAIHAGRWVLRGPVTGFDTWTSPSGQVLQVEGHAPADWAEALTARGHAVQPVAPYDSAFGHAHAIIRDEEGCWAGAADPRARVASAAGG